MVKKTEAFHSPSPKHPQLLSMSYNKMIQNSQSTILENNFLNKLRFFYLIKIDSRKIITKIQYMINLKEIVMIKV